MAPVDEQRLLHELEQLQKILSLEDRAQRAERLRKENEFRHKYANALSQLTNEVLEQGSRIDRMQSSLCASMAAMQASIQPLIDSDQRRADRARKLKYVGVGISSAGGAAASIIVALRAFGFDLAALDAVIDVLIKIQ